MRSAGRRIHVDSFELYILESCRVSSTFLNVVLAWSRWRYRICFLRSNSALTTDFCRLIYHLLPLLDILWPFWRWQLLLVGHPLLRFLAVDIG
jgi:hypothetical protein